MHQQRTLFDEPVANDISFAVAILAASRIAGLGQKSVESLVGELKDDLGRLFRYSGDELIACLKRCRIASPEKIGADVVSTSPNLLKKAEEEAVSLEGHSVSVLSPSQIPHKLSNIKSPPKWLFVQGRSDTLRQQTTVAVVGTRKPSPRGITASRIVTSILSAYPLAIVSGLAEGIDEAIHETSIRNGTPNIAFLGHGINQTFPEKNITLRSQIVEQGGAIVSEYLPCQHSHKSQFVARNRLQAGLADLVIIIEANAQSGTAHTVKFARSFNRRVIGAAWESANGIMDDLRGNNETVIDVLKPSGRKKLDSIIQEVITATSGDPYPFRNVERAVEREIASRFYSESDIARLIQSVSSLGLLYKQEPENNG